jgi:hypothetical protein
MYKLYLKVKERVEGVGLLVIREVRSVGSLPARTTLTYTCALAGPELREY